MSTRSTTPRRTATAVSVLLAVAIAVAAGLLRPLLVALFAHPDAHGYASTPHPASPYTPPRLRLSPEQLAQFHSDGVLVLKGALDAPLRAILAKAADDMSANQTTQCELGKWVGPSIFHSYQHFCPFPHMLHDGVRDLAYRAPLAHVANQVRTSDSANGSAVSSC